VVIGRFIDEEAEFVFVHDPDEVPENALAFDVRGVELSHYEDACTFETMFERYRLNDPALVEIARIVHEADLDDNRLDAPRRAGSTSSCAVPRWSQSPTSGC